jgi:hypothetical protein
MISGLHLVAIIQAPNIYLDRRSVVGIAISDLCAAVATEFAVSVLRRLVTRRYPVSV